MTRKATTLALIFRILFVVYLLAILYLCFGHFDHLPKVARTILGIETDKVVHFLMFLPFPVLSFLAWGRSTATPWQSLLLSLGLFLAGALIAAATELGQRLTPYRSGDPLDFRADLLALAAGALIVLIIDLSKQFRR